MESTRIPSGEGAEEQRQRWDGGRGPWGDEQLCFWGGEAHKEEMRRSEAVEDPGGQVQMFTVMLWAVGLSGMASQACDHCSCLGPHVQPNPICGLSESS